MKSLNFNTNPTNQLKEYLLFLEKAGYKISLCNLGGSFCPSDEIPPRFFLHDNDYCSAVKKANSAACVARQKELCRALKDDECILSLCPAGVAEYVCKATEQNQTLALVCLTGYRTEKRENPSYASLNPDIPKGERALAILRPITRLIRQIAAETINYPGDTHSVCREIKLYVKDHLNENFTLNDLCRHVNFSPSYVGRKFKEQTGESVMRYVNRQKIAAAKSLLDNPSVQISAVADRLGYYDANYFSAFFKKQTGLSPSEYRKQSKSLR